MIASNKDNVICVATGSEATECPITDIKFVPGDGKDPSKPDGEADPTKDEDGSSTGDNVQLTWIEYKN